MTGPTLPVSASRAKAREMGLARQGRPPPSPRPGGGGALTTSLSQSLTGVESYRLPGKSSPKQTLPKTITWQICLCHLTNFRRNSWFAPRPAPGCHGGRHPIPLSLLLSPWSLFYSQHTPPWLFPPLIIQLSVCFQPREQLIHSSCPHLTGTDMLRAKFNPVSY